MGDFGSATTSFTVPQHPLPEEIQKMDRDETVCKFCGVSYLIHNEVKALQERLAETERQMEYYKGSVEREKVLKAKLEKVDAKVLEQSSTLKEQEQQLELFKADLKMKANLVNDMYSQKRKIENDLKQEKSNTEKLKTQLSQLSTVLPKLNDLVRQHRDSLQDLKKEMNRQNILHKDKIKSVRTDLERIISKVVKKVQSEKKSAEINLKNMNELLLKSQEDIVNLRATGSQLSELRAKSGDLQSKVTAYQTQIHYLEGQNQTFKEKSNAIEKELDVRSHEARKLKNELETLQKEKQDDQLNHQETITKKDDDIARLNALCKSLEKLMYEKSASEMNIREQATDKDVQLKTLEASYSKAKAETENMRLEREQTIVAHHNRIEQLRESYVKKLGESATSYGKLQQELDNQRKKFEKDFEEAKMEMRENFEKEKEAINVEHAEQLRIIEAELENLSGKLEKEGTISRSQKEELYQLKNALSSNKSKSVQEIQKYQNEVLDLKAKLDECQDRLKNLQDQNKNNEEITVSNRKYQTLQKSLQDANSQVKLLKEELKNNKNEMAILQDTVRRECEERLELTQALSNARIQLLSSQQNSGAPRHSPTTKANQRLMNRPSVTTKTSDFETTTSSDLDTSVINIGNPRRTKSTGSDSARPTRESVDSFRERIAVALGRPNRSNITR